MTDLVLLAILIAAASASIVLAVWQGRRNWQQMLWDEVRRDLDRHHIEVLKHYGQIQRQLDHHGRTLQYLARRLS